MDKSIVTNRNKNGLNIREERFPDGRVSHSLVIPEEFKDTLLDLAYLNMESLLNRAQMNSYFELLHRECDIPMESDYETEFFVLRSEEKKSFNNNDLPPIEELPSDVVKKKVNRNKFLEHEQIPEKVKRSMFGDPYFMMNTRSGMFNFAESLVLMDKKREKGVSREDELLSIMLDLQEKQLDIEDEMEEVKKELKDGLTPVAESVTSKQLTNTSVYFYPDDIDDKVSSRVSMSKQRRFSFKEAEIWLDKNAGKFDTDEVRVLMCDTYKLRREYPEIYNAAQTVSYSYSVEEI